MFFNAVVLLITHSEPLWKRGDWWLMKVIELKGLLFFHDGWIWCRRRRATPWINTVVCRLTRCLSSRISGLRWRLRPSHWSIWERLWTERVVIEAQYWSLGATPSRHKSGYLLCQTSYRAWLALNQSKCDFLLHQLLLGQCQRWICHVLSCGFELELWDV